MYTTGGMNLCQFSWLFIVFHNVYINKLQLKCVFIRTVELVDI